MSGPIEKVTVKATIKKVATTASKGGTAVVQLEIPLAGEAAALLEAVNTTAMVTVDFTAHVPEGSDGTLPGQLDLKED